MKETYIGHIKSASYKLLKLRQLLLSSLLLLLIVVVVVSLEENAVKYKSGYMFVSSKQYH